MVPLLLASACGDDGGGASTATSVEAAGTPTPALPAQDDALVAAVAGSFCATFHITRPDGTEVDAGGPLLAADEAMCIAEGLIDRLGASRVRQMGLGTYAWDLLGLGLGGMRGPEPITAEDAEAVADTVQRCAETWELLVILSVTQGASAISEASAACTRDALSDEDARTILVDELDRPYDDPSQRDADPFGVKIQPLIDAYDECLTPEERDRLDFG